MEQVKAVWHVIWQSLVRAVALIAGGASWLTGKLSGSGFLGYLGVAWRWLLAGVEKLRASFFALLSSPLAWTAVIAIGLTAFIFGYGAGSGGKRHLQRLFDETSKAEIRAIDRALKAEAAAARMGAELTDVKQKLSEASRKPAAAPVAAKHRPAATKAAKPEAAAPVPAWNPFKW